MGDDDIRRIYDKLDALSETLTVVKTNQDWVRDAVVTNGKTLARIDTTGCQRGREDRAAVESLSKQFSVPRKDDDGRTFAGMSYGKWKAGLIPAVVISVFIGIAILQYSHTIKVAAVVKQEAKTEAAEVAKVEVKRERRAIDRDDLAALVRDEMAAAIQAYIQKQDQKP